MSSGWQVRSGALRSTGPWLCPCTGLKSYSGKIIGNLAYMDLQVVSNPDGTLQQSKIEPREKG